MKLAVCNELFGRISLDEAACISSRHGFRGIELAPFTVFGDFSPSAIQHGVQEAKRALDASGLRFAGFHWLLAKPDGLHITTPDGVLRKKSWDHLRRLIDAAAELGGGNLILGSPKQRSTVPGQTRREAIDIVSAELAAAIAPFAAERQSPVLLERFPPTRPTSSKPVDRGGGHRRAGRQSRRRWHVRFSQLADEASPHATLIDRHIGMIRHVHFRTIRRATLRNPATCRICRLSPSCASCVTTAGCPWRYFPCPRIRPRCFARPRRSSRKSKNASNEAKGRRRTIRHDGSSRRRLCKTGAV